MLCIMEHSASCIRVGVQKLPRKYVLWKHYMWISIFCIKISHLLKYLILFIWEEQREWDRELSHPGIQSPIAALVKSWALSPHLTHGWQGPRFLSHHDRLLPGSSLAGSQIQNQVSNPLTHFLSFHSLFLQIFLTTLHIRCN